MEQIINISNTEILTLKELTQPLSIEETIYYLRKLADDFENCLSENFDSTKQTP